MYVLSVTTEGMPEGSSVEITQAVLRMNDIAVTITQEEYSQRWRVGGPTYGVEADGIVLRNSWEDAVAAAEALLEGLAEAAHTRGVSEDMAQQARLLSAAVWDTVRSSDSA